MHVFTGNLSWENRLETTFVVKIVYIDTADMTRTTKAKVSFYMYDSIYECLFNEGSKVVYVTSRAQRKRRL